MPRRARVDMGIGMGGRIAQLARLDWQLMQGHRRVRWAVLGIIFVPAIYALIYLSSVWNPAGRTQALPVLIVNADRGADYLGRRVQLGDELVRRLRERPAFGYEAAADEVAARHAVSAGNAQFALLIAPDFSQRAVAGDEPGAARIVIYTSEGNDYSGAGFAKRFAPELARQVNEALNRERWALVLQKAAGTQVSLGELHVGVERLLNGVRELEQGSGQLRQGSMDLGRGLSGAHDGALALKTGGAQSAAAVGRLNDGVRRMGNGLRGMSARLPPEQDLTQLASGAQGLADGQRQLGQGLVRLEEGAQQLHDGAARFKAEGEQMLLGGERIASAAGQLQDGAGQLSGGLAQARDANGRLAEGAVRLGDGVRALTEGLLPLGQGLRQAVQALPADEDLVRLGTGLGQLETGAGQLAGGLQALDGGAQRLSAGLQRLEAGAAQLAGSLQTLAAALPDAPPIASGNAGGLAGAVQPVVEVVAPVPANGAGFAPNFIAVALWVGATLCSFIWPLRRLPQPLAGGSPLALVLGKLALPGAVACVQALVLLLMLKTLLPVPMPGGWQLVATLLAASLAFLAIQMALVRMLGETGKAVALLLLITQISAGGGTLPVALTTDFHRAIHPFLPFTWAIRALRTAMFGAFEGAWAPAIGALLLVGLVALLLAAFVGRWKPVPLDDYRPALEID